MDHRFCNLNFNISLRPFSLWGYEFKLSIGKIIKSIRK